MKNSYRKSFGDKWLVLGEFWALGAQGFKRFLSLFGDNERRFFLLDEVEELVDVFRCIIMNVFDVDVVDDGGP